MTKFYYLVSYHFKKSNFFSTSHGLGNAEISTSGEELTSYEDIRDIESQLCSISKFDRCVILNFQLLRKED